MSTHLDDTIRDAFSSFGEHAPTLATLTIRDAEKYLAEVHSALANDNPQAAGLAAHALKSILRQVQATEAADLALGLEKGGKAGNLAECRDLFAPLSKAWEGARSVIESFARSA